jgi:DNA-binding transcriptional regulator LsrR (DeoR family)
MKDRQPDSRTVQSAPRNGGNSSDLEIKIAWMYYIEKFTQEEIAERFGLSRVKVMRILSACAADGVVVTRINRPAGAQIRQERALEARFGLSAAIVVPTPERDQNVERAIGHAVANYLDASMVNGTKLAVGGGATLYGSLEFISRRPLETGCVIGLVGNLPHSRWINPSIVAARLADAFGIESYQITAPVVVDSPDLRDLLWQQQALRLVRDLALEADIALLTVGDLSRDATIFRHEIVSPDLIAPLKRKGAVANVLCHFIDEKGALVDHPINRRVVAIDLVDLNRCKEVVLAAGGPQKVDAIKAALKAVNVTKLITDQRTADLLIGTLGQG